MVYLIRILFFLMFVGSSYSQELDRIAVIVNDGVVLESDIQIKISDYKKNAALDGLNIPPDSVLREIIVDQLILEELQLQIADRVGIKISDEELNLTIKSLAQQNDLTLENFISYVAERGDSYARLREDVKRNLKIRRVQQGSIQNKISITREEVESFLKKIKTVLPEVQVFEQDERFTTTVAQKKLQDTGHTVKSSRQIIDEVAAVEILQSFLDQNGEYST